MNDSTTTFANLDESTLRLNLRPIGNTTMLSTPTMPPQQNGHFAAINTQTVVKKRVRQGTVTVDSGKTVKEIDEIFSNVKAMSEAGQVTDQMQELQRQIQKLFIQKDREWEYKMNESKQEAANSEELALCKIKLKAHEAAFTKMDGYMKLLAGKEHLLGQLLTTGTIPQLDAQNGSATPQTTARTFSPDLAVEIGKERDALREELAQLENSYSDLFKRYEKMRENCVLLKNSEEELKNLLEEEQAKYQRILSRFTELRDSASEQLNQANVEIQRILKQHEENTLGLRCRLKMNESQIQTLNLTIQGKDTQIEELNKMVEDLMKKNGLMDDEGDDDGQLDNGNGGGTFYG